AARDDFAKSLQRQAVLIGGAEDARVRRGDLKRVPDEIGESRFDGEDVTFGVAREGWRIENDDIERALFFPKTFHPLRGIAVNEFVRGGIEAVEFVIS